MIIPVLILLFVVFTSTNIAAQSINGIAHQEHYRLHIRKTSEPVKSDGELTEQVWKEAEVATGFTNWSPQDIGNPKRQTEVRVTYNSQALFFAFTGYDTTYDIIKTLKRDAEIGASDGVAIVLDPVNQRTNGFVFVLNTMNVQAEDVVSASNPDNNWSWDNKWFSAVKRYTDRWTMEIAIPFKTLRYTTDKKIWGINFLRGDLKSNEYSSWTKMTSNLSGTDLGFTGALVWDAPPPPPGKNISFIPYLKSSVTGDKENAKPTRIKADVGFDAKLAVTPALNLDLTVNPDFSQIEVDQQVTNLTRFNIFFPEKRTFFLENADLFSEYGIPPIRPFYSRRVGLDNEGSAIPILAGARLSGNISKGMRIGLMNMQTRKKHDFPAQNYTALSVQQRILQRSVIKGYFLNRSAFMNEEQKRKDPLNLYGRNTGVEFSFTDSKGLWKAWCGYHLSFKPGLTNKNAYRDAGGGYFSRTLESFVSIDQVGTNYYTDMGFVQRIENYDAEKDTVFRLGFAEIYNPSKYSIFPRKGNINKHQFQLVNLFVWNPDGRMNERQNDLSYAIAFKSTSQISVGGTSQQVNLNHPVKFVNDDSKRPLPAAQYRFGYGKLLYNSDVRKPLNVVASLGVGTFYNGNLVQAMAGVNLRSQPKVNVSLNLEYNRLAFPEVYGTAELYLISSRIEVGFSNNVFWTTFLQYNTQLNNYNVNSRIQYRFKPMSDVFLVYTDNYFTHPFFKNKNRALVLKANWWLNL